jgi:MATE family multidrug resistance protein
MQMIVEAAAFGSITMFLGQLGSISMSASTLAFNVNAVAFVPMIGVSVAVSALVGQQLTGGTSDLAARSTWTALQMGLAYSFVIGVFCLLAPDLFMLGHAAGVKAEAFAEIRETTVVLLRYVAAYCLFDTLQIVFVGALKGAGDTRFVLLTTVLVSAVSILGGWFGARHWGGGLHWWWSVVTTWILLMGAAYSVRFVQGRWREMLVIERPSERGGEDVAAVITVGPHLLASDPKSDQIPAIGFARSERTTLEKSP